MSSKFRLQVSGIVNNVDPNFARELDLEFIPERSWLFPTELPDGKIFLSGSFTKYESEWSRQQRHGAVECRRITGSYLSRCI